MGCDMLEEGGWPVPSDDEKETMVEVEGYVGDLNDIQERIDVPRNAAVDGGLFTAERPSTSFGKQARKGTRGEH
jgi:hypothetical protein